MALESDIFRPWRALYSANGVTVEMHVRSGKTVNVLRGGEMVEDKIASSCIIRW